MNFWHAEKQARAKLKVLTALFLMYSLVLLIWLTLNMIVAMTIYLAIFSDAKIASEFYHWVMASLQGNMLIFIGINAAVLIFILGVSRLSLKDIIETHGGDNFIQRLNARKVTLTTDNPEEARLLNVVQEMSLAANLPAPKVYIIDTASRGYVNALCIGLNPGSAKLFVTIDALTLLTRAELQALVANQIGVIASGFLRLNTFALGIFSGLEFINNTRLLRWFQSGSSSGSFEPMAETSVRGNPLSRILKDFIAPTLWISRILKRHVSYQQNYLLDSLAIKFMRDKAGLESLLKKIEQQKLGNIPSIYLYPADFMLFYEESVKSRHIQPNIEKRLKHIQAEQIEEKIPDKNDLSEGMSVNTSERLIQLITLGYFIEPNMGLQPINKLFSCLPEQLKELTKEPRAAKALIYGLIITEQPQIRNQQLEYIKQHGDSRVLEILQKHITLLDKITPEIHLPLVELAVPALEELSPTQYQNFKRNIETLIKADNKLSIFEWLLEKLVIHHLDQFFKEEGYFESSFKHQHLLEVAEHCHRVLTLIAYLGHGSQDLISQSVDNGMRYLNLTPRPTLPANKITLPEVDDSLKKLRALEHKPKYQLLIACAVVGLQGQQKSNHKIIEVIRVLATVIQYPIHAKPT